MKKYEEVTKTENILYNVSFLLVNLLTIIM